MTAARLHTQLRQLLDERFCDGELRTLCFDLNVDYDDLPGSGKADKARREGLAELIRAGQQARPNAPWPAGRVARPKRKPAPLQPDPPAKRPAIAAGRDLNNSGTMIVGDIQGNVTIGGPSTNR